MIKTITIDVINDKAMQLLEDLEQLKLIRVHKERILTDSSRIQHLKGAMSKQPIQDIDSQLDELRNEWE